MITKSRFVADKIVITRREDGHWDLEAFMPLPGFSYDTENNMAKLTMILEDASFDVEVEYSPRQDIDGPMWQETIPAKAFSYRMILNSWMCSGVGGTEGTFMRQQIVEA